jgi:hypothetical protein
MGSLNKLIRSGRRFDISLDISRFLHCVPGSVLIAYAETSAEHRVFIQAATFI